MFDIDWNDQNVLDEYKTKFFCKKHKRELVTHWNRLDYGHWMRRNVGKACSMPESVDDAHKGSLRPFVQGAAALNKEQAQAILSKYHLLLHPGLRKYFEKINLELF